MIYGDITRFRLVIDPRRVFGCVEVAGFDLHHTDIRVIISVNPSPASRLSGSLLHEIVYKFTNILAGSGIVASATSYSSFDDERGHHEMVRMTIDYTRHEDLRRRMEEVLSAKGVVLRPYM